MEVQDIIEDKKREIRKTLLQREDVPDGVKRVINEIYNALDAQNTSFGVNFESISQYASTQFDTFKRSRLKSIGKQRDIKKAEEMMNDIDIIARNLDNKTKSNVLGEREETDKRESRSTTDRILGEVDALISDIYSHERRILSTKGMNQDRIDQMTYQMRNNIKTLLSKKYGIQIENELNRDNFDIMGLEERIIDEIEDQMSLKANGDRESFQEELKKDAPSLEEQAKDAEQRESSQKQNKDRGTDIEKSLPGDILK